MNAKDICSVDNLTLFFLQDMLKPLVNIALEISGLQKLTGREKPTVIT